MRSTWVQRLDMKRQVVVFATLPLPFEFYALGVADFLTDSFPTTSCSVP